MATISADMNFVLDETNFTAGGFNLAGQVYIQVLPLINSLRLYISDYELLSVTQTVPTVDTTAAFTLIDILGQYLFGYINYELGLHVE